MYVGNTNTKRLHLPGCRAVPMIAPEHYEPSEDGEGFYVLCKWCKCQGYRKGQTALDDFRGEPMKENYQIIEEYTEGGNIEVCHDEVYLKLFEEVGCISGHGNQGVVLMYPHGGGVPVEGCPGLYWVFFVCSHCGYETSHEKAIRKLQRERMADGVVV